MQRICFILRTKHGSMSGKKIRKNQNPENFTIVYDSFNPTLIKKIQIIDVPDKNDMFGEMVGAIIDDWSKIELSKREDYIFGLCHLNDSLIFPNKSTKESLLNFIKLELQNKFNETYIKNYDKQSHNYFFDISFKILENTCEITSSLSKEFEDVNELYDKSLDHFEDGKTYQFKFITKLAPAFNLLYGLDDEKTHAAVKYNNLCFSFEGENYYGCNTITNYEGNVYKWGVASNATNDWIISQETKNYPHILGLPHPISRHTFPKHCWLVSELEDKLENELIKHIEPKKIEKSYDWKSFRVYLITTSIKINKNSVEIISFTCEEIKDNSRFDCSLLKEIGVVEKTALENEPFIYGTILHPKSKNIEDLCCSLQEKINHFLNHTD